MKIGQRDFPLGQRTYIMGILNVTPDSFSDGGRYTQPEKALQHAAQMIAEGADIIDIGGESTRPGHQQISIEEEIARVVPIIKTVKKHFPTVPLSIDTYKGDVCEAALSAGADLVNDIWGFRYDETMAKHTADYGVPCCLMHNRTSTNYTDFLSTVLQELGDSIAIAQKYNITNIILDPGIGFGKTYEQNLEMMYHLEKIKEQYPSYPLLLGTSRKSMIGKALGDVPTVERLEGTLATTAIGIMKQCDFIRVHDVKENKKVCVVTDAIFRKKG